MRKQCTRFDDALKRLSDELAQASAAMASVERALAPHRDGDGRHTHFHQLGEQELTLLVEVLGRWRSLRERSELLRRQARTARAGIQIENRAAEARLRAERGAGHVLRRLASHGGDRRSATHPSLTLGGLNVSHKHSSTWRREAAMSDANFERYLADALKRGARLASADLLRFSELIERKSPKSLR